MKARLYNSPLIQELLDEITPEEMEATKQQMLKQIEMENKTAMMQLLAQLKDERANMPLNIEWDRCYQAIEYVIQNTYLPLEKEQHQETWETAHQAGRFEGEGIVEKNWQTFETHWEKTFKTK